jgi:transcription elongation factor/antiterminator RfaH
MTRHWYALHTKPHKERQVAALLRSREIEIFLPLLRVNPVNPRAAREKPYFPSYLFVQVDLDVIGLSILRWTPGLLRMVEFGGELGTVPASLISQIKNRLTDIRAAGGLSLESLSSGDRIRVVSGTFEGYEGVFDARLSGAERVRVLLELISDHQARRNISRTVPVELDAGKIEKLS